MPCEKRIAGKVYGEKSQPSPNFLQKKIVSFFIRQKCFHLSLPFVGGNVAVDLFKGMV